MAFGPEQPPDALASRAGLLSSLSDRLATPEETRLLDQLKSQLSADLAATPGYPDVVGDIRLLRTLRGFDHCVAEAAAAFRAHLAIRRERGLDVVRGKILERWGGLLWELRCEMLPHGELICTYMPEVLVFSRTRLGDPISVGLWGRGRPAAFVQEVEDWQDKFLEYYYFMNESRMLLLDQASREQNRLVHFVQVFDLESWSVMGNADRSWNAFTTERAGPVGETYHDCNVNFLAIRTTRIARMAYNMIKPLLPKKVTEKVHIFGDEFANSQYLRNLIGGRGVDLLCRRTFAPIPKSQDGRAMVKPRQSFELQVQVPHGGRLCWRFTVATESRWRQQCLMGSLPWLSSDLEFSLSRLGDGSEEPLKDCGPQRVQGDSISGSIDRLEADGAGSSLVVLRWDNTRALVTSKSISYRVQVLPPTPDGDKVASGRADSRGGILVSITWCVLPVCLALSLYFAGLLSPWGYS